MTDPLKYEYIARATTGDGRVLSESRPRTFTLSWSPSLGAALMRGRHPNVVASQLRRPIGSDGEWEPMTAEQIAEARLGSLAGVLAHVRGISGIGEAFAPLLRGERGRETS